MDWLTILWLAIILGFVVLIFAVDRYVKKRRKNRQLGIPNDFSTGNFTDCFISSGKETMPKFGGGSGGGAGASRNFAASTAETTGIANATASLIPPTDTMDTATDLLSTTGDVDSVIAVATEFMVDAAGNTVEVASEVVGAAAEVAGEIISGIIDNS